MAIPTESSANCVEEGFGGMLVCRVAPALALASLVIGTINVTLLQNREVGMAAYAGAVAIVVAYLLSRWRVSHGLPERLLALTLIATVVGAQPYFDPFHNTYAWHSAVAFISVFLLGRRTGAFACAAYIGALIAAYAAQPWFDDAVARQPFASFAIMLVALAFSGWFASIVLVNAEKQREQIGGQKQRLDELVTELRDRERVAREDAARNAERNAALSQMNAFLISREDQIRSMRRQLEAYQRNGRAL